MHRNKLFFSNSFEEEKASELDKSEEQQIEFDFTSTPRVELETECEDLQTQIDDLENKMNDAAENDDFDEAERLEKIQSSHQYKLKSIQQYLEHCPVVEETIKKENNEEDKVLNEVTIEKEESTQNNFQEISDDKIAEKEDNEILSKSEPEREKQENSIEDEKKSEKNSKENSNPEKSQESNDDQVELNIVKNISEAEEIVDTKIDTAIQDGDIITSHPEENKEVVETEKKEEIPPVMSLDMFEKGINQPVSQQETTEENNEKEEYSPPVIPLE